MTANKSSIQESWNHSMPRSQMLCALLHVALRPLTFPAGGKSLSSALILPNGETLHVEASGPADLVTLELAASTCHQYLRLKDSDIALVNDPTCGGTRLSDFSIATGIRIESDTPADKIDFILVSRLSLAPHHHQAGALEHEGVRIPPTPIGTHGRLNFDLVNAISAHPLAPPHLAEELETVWRRMQKVVTNLKAQGQNPRSPLKKSYFEQYFADTSKMFETHTSRLPLGATMLSTTLQPSGETVKLKLEITEDRVLFDFTGSDSSEAIGLPELATFSACISTVLNAMNGLSAWTLPIPMNSRIFHHFQIRTPAKSLLSSKPPIGTVRGLQSGLSTLCDLTLAALGKLNKEFRSAESAGTNGYFELEFENGKKLNFELLPGSPASKRRAGRDAFARWGSISNTTSSETSTGLPSVEFLESQFPIIIESLSTDPKSTGTGYHQGGAGQSVSIRILETAKLSWNLGSMSSPKMGFKGAEAGSPAKIIIYPSGNDPQAPASETILASDEPFGTRELNQGERVNIIGSGGGGYGETHKTTSVETESR